MMVLSSVSREMGVGAKTGAICFVVGSSEIESMVKALFIVVKSGGGG